MSQRIWQRRCESWYFLKKPGAGRSAALVKEVCVVALKRLMGSLPEIVLVSILFTFNQLLNCVSVVC